MAVVLVVPGAAVVFSVILDCMKENMNFLMIYLSVRGRNLAVDDTFAALVSLRIMPDKDLGIVDA